ECPVTVTTKDQHSVAMTVSAAVSYSIQVTVTAEDSRPWTGTYDLMVINTDQRSIADTLAPFNRQLMTSHSKMLGELSWWRRLRYRGVSSKLRVLVVDGAKVTPHETLPIDEASEDFSVAEGVKLPYGYWVPALG